MYFEIDGNTEYILFTDDLKYATENFSNYYRNNR